MLLDYLLFTDSRPAPILLFDPGGAILPPRPHFVRPSRAAAVEGAASRRRRLVLDGREHGGMLVENGLESRLL